MRVGELRVLLGRARPPEDRAARAEHVDRRDEGAEDPRERPDRVLGVPRAEEDHHLGDEAGRAGEAERREAREGEGERDDRHRPAEAAHLRDDPRVAALVDEADEREEQARHHAVREHLVDGAVPARRVERRRAEHDHAHVAHRRVGDDVLEVLLAHRRERAVDDVDHRDRADDRRPGHGALGEHHHADAHHAEGAELHQHARVEHRDRGRRRGVAVRRPGVEREDAGEGAEAEPEQREHDQLGRARVRGVLEGREVEAPRLGLEVEPEDPDEDRGRAHEQHERQLHRGVLAAADVEDLPDVAEGPVLGHRVARAPDADEEVHRQDGDLVEEEEDQQILRDEDAEDARHEHQEVDEELLVAALHREAREDRGEDDDAGQQEERDAPAVDREVEADPEGRHERDAPRELEAPGVDVVGDRDQDRSDERHAGAGERHEPRDPAVLLRDREERERGERRGEDDDGEGDVHDKSPQTASATAPSTTAKT
ncbi:MAG: hypothetical protein R3B82_05500 [Sandaracinaceae bacterium]